MRIHPAGFRVIISSILIIGILNTLILAFFVLPLFFIITITSLSLLFLVLIIRFFRYPSRKPENYCQGQVYAAADGQIVAIEKIVDEQFYKGPAIQISTFMSPYDVHLNWVPVEGKVEQLIYVPGKYLVARNPKSSMLNEMSCVALITKDGHKVVVKQIAGIVARRILPFLKEGQYCHCGDELGFIRFGSRVDVLVPPNSKILVTIGQKSRGLQTVLAQLPEKKEI